MPNSSKNIYLICGESGVGKDTIVSEFCKVVGTTAVKSYTTRPKRYEDEDTHTFVTDKEYDKLKNIVAKTIFDGYRYCATQEQIDNATFYIIDLEGIKSFKERYKGNKNVKVVYITCSEDQRRSNMIARGDSIDKVEQRIIHDRAAFANIENEYNVRIINEGTIGEAVNKLFSFVLKTSGKIVVKKGMW